MKRQKFNKFSPSQMEVYFYRMHLSGQAVKQVSSWSGRVEFVACKPEEMVYRLDFYQPSKKEVGFFPEYDDHYLSFFQDTGWEMVCAVSPYVVWRKPVEAVSLPDEALLYNDRESLYQYQKKLVTYRILSTAIFPLLALTWRITEWKWQHIAWNGMILLVWLGFVGYQGWTLSQLKKELIR
ncbi:DUF2812 domain-containing protein [Streptococcus cuniculi]|uniref:DUF2812 domain-containing protein n=1 Tax=Streptococcus cuniculi TaxID=1432788 RepID=A0A4Y9J928_9STRE|nr:DUF2812 domain-containing protein [Streptococcus cuniculi]MBF0778797.1 DUF2812 domain-containing protein [Streptococcus cuniculi]TFU97297.1 DUF2812 domain-containing protein [Streptococcus cuniculi]